jgi:Amt family ammonium transporter
MELIWVVLLGAAALLVRLGQTLYYAGLSRSKNAAGASLRCVTDVCVSVVAFWAIGQAILSQTSNGFFGIKLNQLFGWDGTPANAIFTAALVLIGTGAVGGAVAERSKFLSMLAAWAVLAAFVLPVTMFWTWRGWLTTKLGVIDVAGAGAIHLAAGAFALAAAAVVGPRTGKYNRDGSASMIPAHNVPLVVAGAVTLMVGFVPYVAGAALLGPFEPLVAARGAFNTLLAGAAGGLAAIAFSHLRYGKPDIGLAVSGLLGGLVAITAGAGLIGAPAAFVTGAVAGLIVPFAAIAIDLFARVDDPAGGVAVHGVGGAWGLLAAALFAPGTLGEHLKHLGANLGAIVAIAAFAGGVGLALFVLLRKTVGVRSKEADEYDGLDLAEHDIGAYPDFQQTMIKSYHLREA